MGRPGAVETGRTRNRASVGDRFRVPRSSGKCGGDCAGPGRAGPGWTGKVATVTTTEYVNGKAQKVTAKFRAYDSYKESFQDYAQMINNNPRYATARAHTGSAQAFAGSLQKAGYATDPAYAAKLSRVIIAAQQLQRSQA